MELIDIDNQETDQKPISVLEGNEFCIGRILARESSVGQSSRIFYRASEGVPFKWEMQPGTPKNIPHQEEDDNILPICPSPLMQSLCLPLPNIDHQDQDTKDSSLKTSKIWSLRKIVKKGMNSDIGKKMETLIGRKSGKKPQLESSRFGEYSSSYCSDSSSSSSSCSSFSSNSRAIDTSTAHGPFCCSPLNVPAILDEGNKRIYYCSKHKTAFAVEDGSLFLSRIQSTSDDQFSGPLSHNGTITPAAGVPFRWEVQPGTPKNAPENDVINILPPSPPPAVQSSALPLPRLRDGGGEKAEVEYCTWAFRGACFTIRRKSKLKKTGEIEFDASFRETGSVSSFSSLITPLSKGGLRVSKVRRSFEGGCFGCGGPWRRKDVLVFARRKFKSFLS